MNFVLTPIIPFKKDLLKINFLELLKIKSLDKNNYINILRGISQKVLNFWYLNFRLISILSILYFFFAILSAKLVENN